MTLAVAEMYVQGVSARKVTAIGQELCGVGITSTQVSRATAERDEQLTAWRNRPIGEITYLILEARCEKVRHGGAELFVERECFQSEFGWLLGRGERLEGEARGLKGSAELALRVGLGNLGGSDLRPGCPWRYFLPGQACL